jgi:hypothetical protein
MKERDLWEYSPNRVRELSHRIINKTQVLSIDYSIVRGDLMTVADLQDSKKTGSDPFANEELTAVNEVGLNLFLNVVNFCYMDPLSKAEYGYKNKKGQLVSRATGLKAAMAESGVNWGDMWEVSNLTERKWAEIAQLDNNKDFFLGAERGKRIRLFANKLFNEGHDNVLQFLDCADLKTDKLLKCFVESGFFTDEFEKRAQLAVSMLDGVVRRRFGTGFEGTGTLTVMADYRLPQLMYNFGAIKLSDELQKKLESGTVIESGSEEERSLRAAAVVVGESLSGYMDIPESKVDMLLWKLASDMGKKGELKIPHMLVATDKY